MAKKKDELLYKKDIDSLEIALDYIDKLKIRINKDRRKIRELTKERNSLQRAWDGAEDYLDDVTGDKSLIELIELSKNDEKLTKKKTITKNSKVCEKCQNNTLVKLTFSSFYIMVCENNGCKYRERINEGSNKAAK